MDLTVKSRGLPSQLFSDEQLAEIARQMRVRLPDGVEPVFFGELPPFDKSLRWQEIDANGALVGQIKTFNGTTWT